MIIQFNYYKRKQNLSIGLVSTFSGFVATAVAAATLIILDDGKMALKITDSFYVVL